MSLSCTIIAAVLPRQTVEVRPCLMISLLAASGCWWMSTCVELRGLLASTVPAEFMLKHRDRLTRNGEPMKGTASSTATYKPPPHFRCAPDTSFVLCTFDQHEALPSYLLL